MLETFFFFNDTATTEIYTLSLHDALPIWDDLAFVVGRRGAPWASRARRPVVEDESRIIAVAHLRRRLCDRDHRLCPPARLLEPLGVQVLGRLPDERGQSEGDASR